MRTEKKLWRNRKARKELARRLRAENPGLEVGHAHAAGIDVGNSAHYVAVRPDRDPQPVRRFECFTADLQRLVNWLQCCGVKTVALQSTGVYWIPLYDILEERGFEVYLVNARHTKNLPGRKSDVQESQWLLKLLTYGLLNNSFQPPSQIRILRTYWRRDAHSSARRPSSRHVRYRAVPRANRIPAPFSRAHQQKPTRVEGADIVMQSSGFSPISLLRQMRLSGVECTTRLVSSVPSNDRFPRMRGISALVFVSLGLPHELDCRRFPSPVNDRWRCLFRPVQPQHQNEGC
jgi:hypothetical protein